MTGRALLASPLAFLIGVTLGALGGGGSILAVPLLVFVAGEKPSAATTTSLVVVGVAALMGAAGHWRRGRVRLVPGLVFGAVGIPGSLAGSGLNRGLDPDVLLLGFSGLVLVAAWRMAVGCASCTRSGGRRALDQAPSSGVAVDTRVTTEAPARIAKLAAAGTGVGFLTGLFGVGGGFVIVPAFALLLTYPMPEAIGTSLVVIAVNSAVALGARAGAGSIDWSTALLFTAVAVAGVGTGKGITDGLPAERMQRAFAAFLVVIAVYTAARAAAGIV